MEKLTGEAFGLRAAHRKELDTLLQARLEVEEELQKERDATVKKLEAATGNHQRELASMKTQADVALAGMHKMDDMITGNFLAPSGCFFTPDYLALASQSAPTPII